MSENELNPWFDKLPQSTIEKMLNPIADPIGKGLGGVASIIMNPFMKLGIISEQNLVNFESKIKEKNSKIPLENRDSSKQGLALKAVEDSIYQLESEELQEMFANLIASSLDDRKNTSVLPSFSSILKDLTAKDAILFKQLHQLNAVAKVNIKFGNSRNSNQLPVLENILLLDNSSLYEPISINTLERLGLIGIYKNSLIQPEYQKQYREFVNDPLYKSSLQKLDLHKKAEISFDNILVEEGYVVITEFGKQLGNAVIS